MVVWRQLLVAGALVCGSAAVNALQIDNCPDGTFPVSVLDDPVIHCLSGEPCSGTYSSKGLPQGVGACPASTGCALLPNNPLIMGCVAAGRGDVTYVNADGTLSKGGKLVSAPDSSTDEAATSTTSNNSNSGNSKGNSDSSTTATSSAPVTPGTVAAGNLDDDEKESGTPTSDSGSKNTSPSTTPATSSKSSSSGSSKGNLKGSSSNSSSLDSTDTVSTPTPSPTPKQSIEQVNAQQPLADIDGATKSGTDSTSGSTGLGISTVIAIVVGCLAVVAVVAGVRLLKKDKEPVVETPEGNLVDDYGGGITPKEDVILL
uniref:Uncharacterized protein n=1 Tax=Globisporangium ultimum (strain ATCC 200006 / CBS 805.95 / DAOM BR144) TaxID=431595 RepID=K3X151_GLOUD